DVTGYQNELDHLTKTFNKMTSQLFNQRVDLMKANKDLDNRRQFIENVISSVSAGVIGVDKEGLIYLNNERALKLLTPKGDIIQEPLNKVAFEFSSVIEHLRASGASSYSDQLPLDRKGQHKILRVTAVKGQDEGVVITFDDVTPLLQAQRKAAWSDVARKIAHEIKNPLTPIQLSAERLKRRFLKFFTQTKDAEVFQNCIDTIIRQVEQIGNLVSEFSSFARLPEPTFRSENLSNLCKQAVLLQRQAYSSVEFLENYERNYDFECDAQQLGQVLTNLLQNSVQALLESNDENPLEKKPKIWVCLQTQDTLLTLTIEDNGPGFPKFNREKLKEPYFTTRSKGTGLGLAIVTKIIEDHNGSIELGDSPHGGAKVTIQFTNNHSY
ncbi:MAG TPA: ATP-binding protein, partial [Alphaproteobacteria bacterium]|nr:ATP-binding protein [Alphaproteobacteria bacterium]